MPQQGKYSISDIDPSTTTGSYSIRDIDPSAPPAGAPLPQVKPINGLYDFVAGGLSGVGVDLEHPITGTLKNMGKGLKELGRAFSPIVAEPSNPFPINEQQQQAIKGVVTAPIQGLANLVSAKGAYDVGEGLGQTLTQTVPPLIGAYKLGSAGAGELSSLKGVLSDPAVVNMARKYARENLPLVKNVENLKPVLDAVNKAREPKPLPGPYEAGYRDPSPMTTRTPVEPYIEPKLGETGTRVPVAPFTWEETKQPYQPGYTPNTPLQGAVSEAPASAGVTDQAPGALTEHLQTKEALPANPKAALPPSLIYQNVKTGIPQEVHDLLGQGKLNNIARDAEQIRMESGESALDKVDSQVGGTANRQRLLSTAEGQNTIMNLVNAMKRKNIKDILFYSNALDGLRGRVIK